MMCKLVTFDVDFCLAYEKVGFCGAPSHSYDTPPMTSIDWVYYAYRLVVPVTCQILSYVLSSEVQFR
jgi:hypothetical protein